MDKSSSPLDRRAIFGWVLYDWANSAFALTALAAFFPMFFRAYWCAGLDSSFTTTKLGFGNAVAGLLIALMSPFLGAFADAGRSRKKFLIFFMLIGTATTALFPLIGKGCWQAALLAFVVANIGWTCANLFYDALLTCVASRDRLDFVSSLGYSIGYLGCLLLYLGNIAMVTWPHLFGFADEAQAVKAAFLTVSIWWLVFAVPLILFVKEKGGKISLGPLAIVADGFRRLSRTFHEIRKLRHIWLFLVAYWLYIDGVDTVVRMAADLGLAIGITTKSLMVSLALVQAVAFPSALVFGLLAQRIGPLRSLMIGVVIYIGVTLYGPIWVRTGAQFMLLAGLSAVPLGCLQALSRSYYARIIPEERAAEFFGFYNLMGKFAAFVGPALVGSTSLVLHGRGASAGDAARFGFTTIAVLFVLGGIFLVLAGRAALTKGVLADNR